MIISIIRKYIKSFNFIPLGLPILWAVLVAFQSYPHPKETPPIKTKVHKFLVLESNELKQKQHTETTYNIHGDIIQHAEYVEDKAGKSVLKQLKVIKYNRQGLYIGAMVYNKNAALIWSEENSYNDTEQVVKITHTNYLETPINTYTVLSYDEFGNVNLTQTFDHDGNQTSEQKRSYASTGELLSALDWIYVYQDLKPIKKTVSIDNQYNLNGQITQSTMLLHEGKNKIKDVKLFKNSAIIDWAKYENGHLISHFKQQQRDSLPPIRVPYELPPPIPEQTIQLEYDDAKRDPLENIPHQDFRSISSKNNKQGLPIKKVTREYNQVVEVAYFNYNEQNQLIEESIQDKLTKANTQILYEYDPYNSPVQKTIFLNDTLIEQHIFDYQYYRQ